MHHPSHRPKKTAQIELTFKFLLGIACLLLPILEGKVALVLRAKFCFALLDSQFEQFNFFHDDVRPDASGCSSVAGYLSFSGIIILWKYVFQCLHIDILFSLILKWASLFSPSFHLSSLCLPFKFFPPYFYFIWKERTTYNENAYTMINTTNPQRRHYQISFLVLIIGLYALGQQ